MSETTQIQRAATRTAAEADRLSAAFARQLARVLREMQGNLRAWLALQPERPSPAARGQVRSIVKEAGYDALTQAATGEPFTAIAERVIAARRQLLLPVDDSPLAAFTLDAWRQWHADDLLTEGSVLSRALADVVMRGSGRSRRRLPQDLAQILDTAEGRIQTLYDTAVSVFGRQVEAEQAGDDPATAFVYMGPVDAKTRDFCLQHVGRVYTRSAIDKLDNGQISNVFLTAGGWNCRHTFHEVSKASELYDLVNTPRRAPEILDAVREIREAA